MSAFMRAPRDYDSLIANYTRIHEIEMPEALMDAIRHAAWQKHPAVY